MRWLNMHGYEKYKEDVLWMYCKINVTCELKRSSTCPAMEYSDVHISTLYG